MRFQLSAPIIASLCICLSLILCQHYASASGAAAGTGLLVEEKDTISSSILKSDRTNGGPFHRSQSKRAAAAALASASATLAKSLPLISATTQIAKANDEQTATPATTATTIASQTTMENAMHTNASLSVASTATAAAKATATAKAKALPNPNPITIHSHSNINNISNNGDQQQQQQQKQQQQQRNPFTMATSVPGVTSVLQANLIMSNRNVEEQELDEHKYKITQYNVLFPHSSNSNNNNNFTIETTTTTTTATPTTEESTTTTTKTTTTRRPAPRTTLRPPPTIDDYQTIISQAGTHAYLPCNVKQLVKKPISWLRMRDGHILTVDQTTFIADQRFQSVFSPNPERWSLQIKYVQLKDEGTYECQVSTEPKASAIVHLRIVEPKTELIGESTRHVKAGSQVKLRCIISQALEPPLFINWFYNQKQIYLHNRRGWRTEIERIDLPEEASTTTPAATSTSTLTMTAAERLNDIAAITRSYILDAITVSDGAGNTGYGYAIPTTTATTTATMMTTTTTPTAAAMSTTMMTAGAGAGEVVVAAAAAAGTAVDTPATLTTTIATAAATAAAAAAAGAATMTTAFGEETTTATTTTTTEPSTTTTTAATTTTTTTTMLPSSSFIKQITRASLIIPAVVKLDSGNYTCSPSNSAPRTIVLHVLNGEYSASAIKSASVSWNTLIGCPGYLHWRNISTILTLLWIIKFVLARNVAICCNHGRNKVNNPALQESATTSINTITTAAATTTKVSVGESVSRRLCTQTQTATRRQRRLGFDCGGDCGNVSSSISGTKVAEDKT